MKRASQFLAFGLAVAAAEDLGLYVDEATGFLKDQWGRDRVFHGVNVVYKSAPYLPPTDAFDANLSFSAEDVAYLQSWGMNVIRLGAMWPGLEPTRGEYDQSYLAALHGIVDSAAEGGIYTLLDAHQDVFSEKFCGEGVPLWAAQPSGSMAFPVPVGKEAYAVDADGVPSRDDCLSKEWGDYYFSKASASAFDALYQDEDGLRESFAGFWAELAKEFKGSSVIGLELLNEPFAGDVFAHPELVWPGVADKQRLQPFYDVLADAVRAQDPERMIMFESVTWTDELGLKITDTGFSRVPGSAAAANASAFAYHYYSNVNMGDLDTYLDMRVGDAQRLGCGGFVTEFDIHNEDDSEDVFESISTVMSGMETRMQSWIGWEYKPYAGSLANGTCTGCGPGLFHEDGSVNEMTAKMVSRTYAPAVAGTTKSTSFNHTTGAFELVYDMDALLPKAVTEIFIQEDLWYPDGFEVAIEPRSAATWSHPATGMLHVVPADGSNVQVTVRVTALSS